MRVCLVILCLLFSICYCRIDSQRVVNHNREKQVLDDYAADLERLQAYYAYMGINKQDDIVIIDDSEEIKDVDDVIENETIDVEEEVIVKRESVADIRREMRNARNQELKMKTKNINNENVNRDRIKFSDEERILKKEELKSRTEVLLKK